MSPRLIHVALAASAGLALGAAPALASEGPAGPTLPSPLAPVAIVPIVPPAGAPLPQVRPVLPRVLRARLSPRRVHRGRHSRLRATVAGTRLRIVLERTARGRHIRVSARTVKIRRDRVSVRLPKLRPGRYRVTVVALDAQGNRSAAVHRALRVRR